MFVILLGVVFSCILFFVSFTPPGAAMSLISVAAGGAMVVAWSHPSLWFSYLLFLVYLGGVLMMFAYVSSTTSTSGLFSIDSKPVFFALIIMITWAGFSCYSWGEGYFMKPYPALLSGLMNWVDFVISWFSLIMYLSVAVYLLGALIITVGVLKKEFGPFRILI